MLNKNLFIKLKFFNYNDTIKFINKEELFFKKLNII